MRVRLGLGPKFRKELDASTQRGRKLIQAVNTGLEKAVQIGAGEVALTQLGGDPLTTRSGQLANSIRGIKRSGGDTPTGAIGVPPNSPAAGYAGIQEFGGVIRPVQKQWLTIPTELALTKSGRASRISAKDFTDLRFQMIHTGTMAALVRDVGGRRRRTEIFFWLVKKVTIQPTQWLSAGVRKAAAMMARVIDDEIRRAFD